MNYYKVTMSQKGKRTEQIVKAKSKISAMRTAKQEFAGFNIIKAVETTPDMNARLTDMMEKIKKSFEGKIDINQKNIPLLDRIARYDQMRVYLFHDSIDEGCPNHTEKSQELEKEYFWYNKGTGF